MCRDGVEEKEGARAAVYIHKATKTDCRDKWLIKTW